ADYDGTVLIVSHDRDFLDKTVTVTLGLDGSGTVDIVAGGYEDWIKRRASTPVTRKATKPAPQPTPASARGSSKKLSFNDQRDLDRLPGEIERIEREIAEAESALHDPNLFLKNPDNFAALTQAIDAKRAEKDAAEHRWLEVAEMADGLTR
ncbi:MAG TPA: ABC transporter ATP-binding protein, partial [Sphingomicrobium sp.]|nr:ABC transporter ATP-binding protein [Sphingomicrobium sp.]